MTMRLIPHAAAMTEFVVDPTDGVRYTGTCGETAGLALAHPIDPAKYPLNAATLSSIARWEIAQKQASANGSEPISSIASWLTSEGIAHTNYGYAEPPSFDWRGMLAQWGGIKPIVFEYAHAANLPGDEAGVAYHFNTCLGWDTATNSGLFADGDNYVERTGGTALVRYTESDLAAANVCGMLVGEYELGGNMSTTVIPTGWHDDGTVLTAPNGMTVRTGFRGWILDPTHNWDAADTPVSPETHVAIVEYCNPKNGGGTVQFFQFSQLTWTRPGGVWATRAGFEAHALRAQVDTLDTQAQHDAATIGTMSGQIATLQQQVASLKAQLANTQAAPAPAPAPAVTPAPTTPADAAALLVSLIYAQADATLKAASAQPPTAG